MPRSRCDDLVHFAGNADRCFHLAQNSVAGVPHQLRCKAVCHVRFFREKRLRISEFANRLTKLEIASDIALVELQVARWRVGERGAYRVAATRFDDSSQMGGEL